VKPKLPRGVRIDGAGNLFAHSTKTGPEITRHLVEKAGQFRALQVYMEEAREILGFTPHVEDKATLMKVAQFWWKRTYAHVPGDIEAFNLYWKFLDQQPQVFGKTSETEPDILVNMLGARWCDQGFPVVTMGEKYCAALTATDIPKDMAEEVEAPWKCFLIEIPGTDLLQVWDPDEEASVRVTRILVQRHLSPKVALPTEPVPEPTWQWRWLAFSDTNQHIWRSGQAAEILEPVSFREQELHHYYDPEREHAFVDQIAHDERLYITIGRLVINTCLALSNPENVKEIGSSHERYRNRSAKDPRTGPPEQRVYQLGQPIKVDCRSAVKEWLGGHRKSSTVNVQFLVRGHWRNQAHGPKMALRSRRWIEPYWKGEKDAPIPLRSHKLEGSEA
jgi:hypothetical protein